MSTRRRLIAALGAAVLALGAAAQEAGPAVAEGPFRHADRIELKLEDRTGAVLVDGRLTSRTGVDLAAVAAVFARARRVEPAFTLPPEVLDRWHREAGELLPAGAVRPGHLGRWFRLHAADAAAAEAILAELRRHPLVEHADLEPIPHPASTPLRAETAAPRRVEDIPPPTPDFTARQTYKGPPPDGVNNGFARLVTGGRGQAVRLVHIEVDWVYEHEDLDAIGPASFIGPVTPGQPSPAGNHGTAVAGVLVGGRNEYGVTGMVEATDIRLLSWETNGGFANSIALAAQNTQRGDVIVIIAGFNLQANHPDDWVPVEFFPIIFDVILTATSRGVLFVEAAMNGDNDLDDPRFWRRFDLSYRDSGAILVGATDGAATRKAAFSNFGSRVDTNGWGDDVTTTGYGTHHRPNNDPRQTYTFIGAGTSGASAIAGGTVTSLMSAVRFQDDRILTFLEVRSLLRAHGTPVTGAIGRRPDLRAMLAALGLPDGLIVDRELVDRGQTLTVTLSGPDGAGCALAVGVQILKTDLGLNRKLHIDPSSMIGLGTFSLTGGTATLPIPVPDVAALQGLELYFQGVRLDGTELHVTSSSEVQIR